MIRARWAAWRAARAAQRGRVREVLGQPRRHGGALVVQRTDDTRLACQLCGRAGRLSVTVLVPVVKGNSRPRIQQEAHQTFTACLRCVIGAALRVRLGIIKRGSYA